MYYFLNGLFLSQDICKLSTEDRGLLLGQGVFETIYVDNYTPCYLSEHWVRICQSANKLGFSVEMTYEQLQWYISQLIEKNALGTGGIRITITAGVGERGLVVKIKKPTILIQCFNYERRKHSIRLGFSSVLRNQHSPIIQLKTINYLELILAKQKAIQDGYDDALLCNLNDLITESTTANFFIIKKDKVITAPISDGLLPGIMRTKILSMCQQSNVSYEINSISKKSVVDCDAAFLTNCLIGIAPVSQVENIHFSQHPIVNQLSAML